MFRKLVANLSFSPALVGQLGFYAKRLRKEEITRRVGLVFTALALVVQSFALFSPPEAVNAASSDSIIYQSLANKAELLKVYDAGRDSAGHTDIKQIYSYFGITRQDILNSNEGMVDTRDFGGQIKFTGRTNYGVSNRWAVKIPESGSTIYTGGWQDKPYKLKALIGKRAVDGKWFALMLYCGNVLYVDMPPEPPKPTAACSGLAAVPLSRNNYRFTATASTTAGATISNYNFVVRDTTGATAVTKDVQSSASSASFEHTFAKDGTYTSTVTVTTSVGKKTSNNCSTPITISPAPVAECSTLTLTSLSRTKFRFDAKAVASNGAGIKSYTYIVKDTSNKEVLRKTVASTSTTNQLEHSFAANGKYTVSVVVSTSLGERTSAGCNKSLTVTPEPRCPLNPDLVASNPDCKPCADDPTIWYKDENCAAKFELNKVVKNATQDIANANNTTAKPSDVLQYMLSIKNTGKDTGTFTPEDDLTDTLEYATVQDLGGGTIKKDATLTQAQRSIVKWNPITLKPGEAVTKIITVKVNDEIAATSRHESARNSYDCKITNVFGQTVNVNMECPPAKVVETIISELPKTGMATNLLASGAVLAVVTYFYARSRQLKKEVRLIRHDLNAGTI